MKKTEIVFLLDNSGSMNALKSDVIGGFNQFLDSQKEADGDATMSLVKFDSQVDVSQLEGKSILEFEHLNEKSYQPNGMTALVDALGLSIDRVKSLIEKDTKVVFAIMTDGEENSSREYTMSNVKKQIEDLRETGDWEFIFLGANIDVIRTASNFGMNPKYAGAFVSSDSASVLSSMNRVSDMTTTYRNTGDMVGYDDE